MNCHDAIKKLHAEDMFAIGCIIAETFLGRSLLSNQSAEMIAGYGNQVISDNVGNKHTSIINPNAKTNITAIMNLVYKEASQLPLALRRLISMLVQVYQIDPIVTRNLPITS